MLKVCVGFVKTAVLNICVVCRLIIPFDKYPQGRYSLNLMAKVFYSEIDFKSFTYLQS